MLTLIHTLTMTPQLTLTHANNTKTYKETDTPLDATLVVVLEQLHSALAVAHALVVCIARIHTYTFRYTFWQARSRAYTAATVSFDTSKKVSLVNA